MIITDVDIIPIYPAILAANADQQARFINLNHRTIFKVATDNGIVGYGDARCEAPPRSSVEHVLGKNPFDYVNADLNMGLMGALYDVMGKHLELPAWKLMGQKVRERVPVTAWTRPASPEDLASAVERAVNQGYRLFKMHTCAYYDLFEQHAAVEEVAPRGFKMHYDLNGNRSLAAVSRIVQELERSPAMGAIEDPLDSGDIEGWRRLRDQTSLPLVMHNPRLGGVSEIIHGCADAFMVGERGVGAALKLGLACGGANLSTVIQLTGGTLTKAMALHLGAVLPNVSYAITLDDQYDEDVVAERIEVVEGSSPVPQGPGLGVEVDEEALRTCAANRPTELAPTIGIVHLPGGHRIFTKSTQVFTKSFGGVQELTGFPEGHIRGIRLDVWEDDGSESFKSMWQRLESEESIVVEGSND